MITLGDVIVAGVKRASISNGDADDNGENADDDTSAAHSLTSRVTATSGSVGSAFRNRNNKRQRQT